jgi:hypothetical protein
VDPKDRAHLDVLLEWYREIGTHFRYFGTMRWPLSAGIVVAMIAIYREASTLAAGIAARWFLVVAYIAAGIALIWFNVWFEVEFVKSWAFRMRVEREINALVKKVAMMQSPYERLGKLRVTPSTSAARQTLLLGALILGLPPAYLLAPRGLRPCGPSQVLDLALGASILLLSFAGMEIAYHYYQVLESRAIGIVDRPELPIGFFSPKVKPGPKSEATDEALKNG